MADEITERGREKCGCLGCCGLREIGAHTIQTPDNPRPTPSTCVAAVYIADELAGKREDARWEIERERHVQVLRSIDALVSATRGSRR